METSTTSASMVSAAPPLAGSTVAFRRVPDVSTAVTFDDSLNVMPCFSKRRCAWRRTSPSMPGSTPSRNSTTVTLAPSRRHTEPNSSPITPAPTTSRCSGTLSSASAPVDDTMRFSSISMPCRRATSEPVAMTMDLVSSVCVCAVGALHLDLAGRGDAAGAVKSIDLVLLEQELDALDVAVDALVLERHHRRRDRAWARTRRCPSCRSCARPPRTIRRRAAAPSTGCSRY